MRTGTSREPMAVTSSLNSIHISPRTPKTPRPNTGDEQEDVELTLLNEEERLRSARAFHDDDNSMVSAEDVSKRPISAKDKRGMVLLCVLCTSRASTLLDRPRLTFFFLDLLQGVPVRYHS
jgi:PAT family acetyl-CoA transporter-like MFS transporter 1